ncbi:hypothetical protein [Spirosoma luteum]|uniref:hypothetical protein n=1 Tax=Spirosoma luteum TaxID=431553 RepID=UPI000380CAE9|nr:hypothetical protein [Spirosoma luteum]
MLRLLTIGISLYLSLFSLLPVSIWEECAKLPELYQHYQLHRLEEPDHSFLDFLAEHYGDRGDHHAPHHDHAKLPVKAAHSGADAGWAPVYLPGSPFWTNALCASPVIAPKTGFHYQSAALPEPTLSFWQPPKIS